MPEVYDALADRLLGMLAASDASTQKLICVAGGPGAGKSTLTREVIRRVNERAEAEVVVVVPMDGYHYTRAELDATLDPKLAHARRGAHWTFDVFAFVRMVHTLRETRQVAVPSFDHALGDPIDGDIRVSVSHRIVLLEGNYLLLDYYPWDGLRDVFDEKWFVDCALDEAMQRVQARHIETGISPEQAAVKVRDNDRINGELIQTTRRYADVVVLSIDTAT